MKRIVVTNNKKVENLYSDKADVVFLENTSGLEVLKEGKQIAEKGGKLLFDPTRYKGFYRSLVFYKNGDSAPEKKSLSMIDTCIEDMKNQGNGRDKEPLLAGILQKRDLEVIKKILS